MALRCTIVWENIKSFRLFSDVLDGKKCQKITRNVQTEISHLKMKTTKTWLNEF